MSDLKISELLDGGSAQLTDQIAIARAGGSYELTLGEVKVLILGTLATDVSNNATAITALQNDRLKLDGSNGPMTGNLDMGANKITSTYVPAADADLVNRKYVTDNYLPLSGGTMTGAITLHSTGTPASGSEPISYTFAEATYAKATGTLNFVARFSPDGTTLDESTIRDDGSNASINGTIDSSSQLKIVSSETNALLLDATGSKAININQTGTGADKFGVFISATGTNASNYFGFMADVNNAGSGKSYGASLNSTISQGAAFGLEVDVTTRGDGNTGIELTGVHVDGVRVNTGDSADSAYGVLVDGISGAGTVTNAYNFYGAGISTTTASNSYGLYLGGHVSGTKKYGIYQVGTTDHINYFGGRIGLGDSNPSSSTMLKVVPDNKYGVLVDSTQSTSSTVVAFLADIDNSGTGNIEAYYAQSGGTNDASAYSALYYSYGVTGGTQANSYHLYLNAHAAGTNKWGIYQEGTGDENRFNGKTGFNNDPVSDAQVYITNTDTPNSDHKGLEVLNSNNHTGHNTGIKTRAWNTTTSQGSFGIWSVAGTDETQIHDGGLTPSIIAGGIFIGKSTNNLTSAGVWAEAIGDHEQESYGVRGFADNAHVSGMAAGVWGIAGSSGSASGDGIGVLGESGSVFNTSSPETYGRHAIAVKAYLHTTNSSTVNNNVYAAWNECRIDSSSTISGNQAFVTYNYLRNTTTTVTDQYVQHNEASVKDGTTVYSILSDIAVAATGVISNYYGHKINAPTGSGNINTAYGIHIGALGGTTANYGIYEAGGMKNTDTRNILHSRLTIGNEDDFTSTKIMLSVEGYMNDVSQTLTGYDGESAGYTSGYDEYNITRSVSGASGYQGTTQFGSRNTSVASGDFTFMTLLLGQDNSSRNCLGIIGVQASSGVSNHETDMIFGVRGSGSSNPTNPEDTRAHVQEAIRIKSGTSGSFTGGSTDNQIDATTVTAPRVQFGGSNGYTFPAEDGSPGQRLQTDGSGNLTWVTP
jgi:hypothetical protein